MRPPADRNARNRSTALAAVLIAFGLAASAMPSRAASLRPVEGVEAEEAHSCPCGMGCKGKCCCAARSRPKREEAPPKTDSARSSESDADTEADDAGCCVSPSPCGGGAVPPQSTRSLTLGDPAWLGLSGRISPAALGEPVLHRPDRDWQVPGPPPVDDPPEGLR